MLRPTPALAVALALALLAAPALAQVGTPATVPPGASTNAVGNFTLAHWVGSSTEVAASVPAGTDATLWFAVQNASAPVVLFLNVTSPTGAVVIENGTLVLRQDANSTALASVRVLVGNGTNGTASYSFAGEAYEEQNGTLVLAGPASGAAGFLVVGIEAPVVPPAGLPEWVWAGLAVGLVGLVAAGVLIARQRAVRRRMNEGPRRSQVMRELELERQLEKAKDPDQVQEIKAEIRQQEQVREKRRELQILEAKRADALKTLDLLRKRHEAGGLTKLQYDNMVGKKQADLQRIESEIAQMEAEDAAGAAAS